MPKLLALVLILMAPLAAAQTFIISDIRVEGLQRISAGSVFAALPVAVGDVVDERAVRAAARGLFATCAQAGWAATTTQCAGSHCGGTTQYQRNQYRG